MNKISISPFEQFPLELYTKMIGIDDSFKIEDLDTHVMADREMLRSWITLAMTSHRLFTNVMHALHSSTIFKSLVSQSSEDRESFSLYRAFKPSVDFVKNMSDPNGIIVLFDQQNPNLQARIQSFFDIFWCIHDAIYTRSKELPVICNIVEFVPYFLFELSMAGLVGPSATSVCREHYRKRNGKETLSTCLTALENVSIIPPSKKQDSNERKKIITAIRYCPERLLKFSPNSLTQDTEYSLEYHLAAWKMDKFLSIFEDRKEDEGFALETVRRDGSKLKNFPSFKNNRQVVLAAVQNHRQALKYAHDDLKQDKVIVLTAVQTNGWSLEYAHEDLKKDKNIVLAAVQCDGAALQYAHEDLKKDKEIVLAAVHSNWRVLPYAHNDLKKDKEIVLAAVQHDGWALQDAHEDLKQDKDIVLAAVTARRWALQDAHEDLKKDKNIVLAAVQYDGWALQDAHEDLKKDKNIVLAAIQQDGQALQFADESLKRNEAIVFAAVRQDGRALQYADESLKQNEAVVFAAIQQDGQALQFAHDNLKSNETVALTAVSQHHRALHHVPGLNNNREFILKAMNANYCVFYQLNKEMQQDPEIIAIFNKNRRVWETEIPPIR